MAIQINYLYVGLQTLWINFSQEMIGNVRMNLYKA